MSSEIPLELRLEALLFWKGEPMTKKKAAATLECSPAELDTALAALESSLSTRGLRIMTNSDEIEMRTAPEMGAFIEKLTKDELIRDLGKAGLETLSIILYKSPIKRAEIDYIRGVNSSFILRNLLIRGLIERISEKESQPGEIKQGRGYSYKPTIDLLAHLGVAKIEDLPEYASVKAEMDAFAQEEQKDEQ
ncbi:MAG: SMC-Scp complex subunit ScpB [Patescibacteria group bacterium]|nr:SMC-Scp complex subunit ScpB [Patescibacteria group bacterium]MDE2116797.1 SMC-Scp complex subunit ScpB [Patescibacteria group bacterium]